MEPIVLHKKKLQESMKSSEELMQEKEDLRLTKQAADVIGYMNEQAQDDDTVSPISVEKQEKSAEEDDEMVQIPHETDTDDIAFSEGEDYTYNHQHSKLWNEAVNRKAQEIENALKIEENMKLSQIKAKEAAARRAQEERVRAAEEARKLAEQERMGKRATQIKAQATVDLSELYGNMVPETENIQLRGIDKLSELHSKFYNE